MPETGTPDAAALAAGRSAEGSPRASRLILYGWRTATLALALFLATAGLGSPGWGPTLIVASLPLVIWLGMVTYDPGDWTRHAGEIAGAALVVLVVAWALPGTFPRPAPADAGTITFRLDVPVIAPVGDDGAELPGGKGTLVIVHEVVPGDSGGSRFATTRIEGAWSRRPGDAGLLLTLPSDTAPATVASLSAALATAREAWLIPTK